MEIRFAAAGDIPGIQRLLGQVGEIHHQLRPDIFRAAAMKYNEEELLTLLSEENRPIFVAAEGETVAGSCFCTLREYRGSSVSTDRRELYIDDLCVDEGHRRRGAATALIRRARKYAREQGCRCITLCVWSCNEGAMRFYEAMGMHPRNITMEMPLEESEC